MDMSGQYQPQQQPQQPQQQMYAQAPPPAGPVDIYALGNAPAPAQKGGGGRFFIGLIVGLVAATLLCLVVFAVFYPAQRGGALQGSGSDLLDEETRDKIALINETIDTYYYKDDVTPDQMRDGMYSGLVNSLGDIYSVYYTEEEVNALMQQTTGVYYGIGAYISLHEEMNRAYISGVIPGSPAEEAQLRENDVIWEVDGTSTEGMQTDEVAGMIRGPEGTDVTVVILRGSEEMTFTLTRRRVESQTVIYEMLEDKIGYLQIREFDTVTYEQFVTAYEDLQSQGMRGMILDLRSNPGGSLETVCLIAEEMLPAGEIVYTIDKSGYRESYESNGKNEIQIPLVVLVNGNSASASEILAGAIKDYEKGTLIGTTTFGKGIVQRIFFFDDGTGMKVTVSDYYTPAGNNIHGIGIEPDIVVEYDAEAYEKDGTDNQLEYAVQEMQGMLD